MLGEIEKRIFHQQGIFKVRGLERLHFYVWSNAAAAEHGAPAVRQLHFLGRRVGIGIGVVVRIIFLLARVVIIVERNAVVIALNQPSAWRVVFGCSQRQAGILRQRIHGLYQSLAKR